MFLKGDKTRIIQKKRKEFDVSSDDESESEEEYMISPKRTKSKPSTSRSNKATSRCKVCLP